MLLAGALTMQGAHGRAAALLERACQIADVIPNVEVLLQALALRAVVADSGQGDALRGLRFLQRALDLAAPEGFARPILDAGGALARLLRIHSSQIAR